MTALMAATPLEEERAAARQHRHMEKMQREAERARLRERRAAQRATMRELQKRLDVAERESRAAMREYDRALTAFSKAVDLSVIKLRGRDLDRAYNRAMAAAAETTHLRRKLEEASRG